MKTPHTCVNPSLTHPPPEIDTTGPRNQLREESLLYQFLYEDDGKMEREDQLLLLITTLILTLLMVVMSILLPKNKLPYAPEFTELESVRMYYDTRTNIMCERVRGKMKCKHPNVSNYHGD